MMAAPVTEAVKYRYRRSGMDRIVATSAGAAFFAMRLSIRTRDRMHGPRRLV
jgi:hypothetical protein